MTDTIAAIATPLGTGGIGVVRISGPAALVVAQRVFRPVSGKDLAEAKGYTGMLGRVYDADGDVDDAIAFVYRAPASYTGEDIVELSCHGGIWVVQKLLRLCFAAGARCAGPGEFTKRAFLSGKLRLDEAEAVIGLIEAQSDSALRAALAARDGALSSSIDELVEKIVTQSAHLAAWADYPEEEIEAVESDVLAAALHECLNAIRALLQTYDSSRILREGIDTVIVGRPNTGKSTLMNMLSGAEKSIVTHIPGTTRDVVEEQVRLGDYVLRLADTAGIRETGDAIEQIGVQRSLQRLAQADLVLAVFDCSDMLLEEDLALLEQLRGRACIGIVNKIDLQQRLDTSTLRDYLSAVVELSAKNGTGGEALEEAVRQVLGLVSFDPSAAMVATERQRRCLQNAADSIVEAITVLEEGMTLDAVGVSIDYALDELLLLSGRKATDEVLDAVFSRFCVGK